MLRPLLVLILLVASAGETAAVPTRWMRGTSLDRGHGGWLGDVTGAGRVVDGIVVACAVGLVLLALLVMWLKRDQPGGRVRSAAPGGGRTLFRGAAVRPFVLAVLLVAASASGVAAQMGRRAPAGGDSSAHALGSVCGSIFGIVLVGFVIVGVLKAVQSVPQPRDRKPRRKRRRDDDDYQPRSVR